MVPRACRSVSPKLQKSSGLGLTTAPDINSQLQYRVPYNWNDSNFSKVSAASVKSEPTSPRFPCFGNLTSDTAPILRLQKLNPGSIDEFTGD